MTAPHDTREAVEAMARQLENCGIFDAPTEEAAAMLRRLLARAEAAEQERQKALDLAERHMKERHKAQKREKEVWNMMQERVSNLEIALATARADALREAAAAAFPTETDGHEWSEEYGIGRMHAHDAILSLIPAQETQHDR